jgi:hypothetical protein
LKLVLTDDTAEIMVFNRGIVLQRDLKKMVDIGLLVAEGETHLLFYRLVELR